MLFVMLAAFIVLLFAGMPVAFAMGVAGAIAILGLDNVAPVLIPQRMFVSLNSFTLLAIPFFVLAGELMNRGGITRRVVNLARALVGWLPGSLAQVNVVSSIIMSGFSGSATADAVAIGSVMIPAMEEQGYPKGFSAGVNAASACIGPIIPPSVVMIIYGAITGLSVGKMFLAGIIPGLLIGLAQMIIVHYYAVKYNWPRIGYVGFRKFIIVFIDAFWALLAPVIILGGIITGVTTATEAGVIAVVYALFVGVFIYKEIKLSHLKPLLVRAAINTAVPVLIIAGASLVGWVLARQQFASYMVDLVLAVSPNPNIAYLLIIAMLLIIGLLVEGTAAMLIFVPILFPIGMQFGYDPFHFAIVVMITILIGTITPPVGLQLYVASSIAKIPINKVTVWPFVFVMVAVVLLITYVPILTTFLPYLF